MFSSFSFFQQSNSSHQSKPLMMDDKKLDDFLKELNSAVLLGMSRTLDHIRNGDIREDDLRTFINDYVRVL